MNHRNRNRTLTLLLVLFAVEAVNTVMAGVLDYYSEWVAWTVLGLTIVLIAIALRFQQRLSATATAALLAVPFVLAALGAIIGL